VANLHCFWASKNWSFRLCRPEAPPMDPTGGKASGPHYKVTSLTLSFCLGWKIPGCGPGFCLMLLFSSIRTVTFMILFKIFRILTVFTQLLSSVRIFQQNMALGTWMHLSNFPQTYEICCKYTEHINFVDITGFLAAVEWIDHNNDATDGTLYAHVIGLRRSCHN